MKQNSSFIGLLMVSFLAVEVALAGCRAQPTATLQATLPPLDISTHPQATATPPSTQDRLRQALAEELDVSLETLQLHAIEETQWTDSCLGAPQPDEVCITAITPGFGGILIVEGTVYEFRSDLDITQVRIIPGAALSARQVLANQLGLEAKQVTITLVSPVTWSNACLDAPSAEEMCAEVETPGYRVWLTAQEQQYEYHTDLSGASLRLVEAPATSASQVVLSWSGVLDGVCQQAELSREAVIFGRCDGPKLQTPYSTPQKSQHLQAFLGTFQPFDAQTAAGEIKLAGEGSASPTPADQRMIAEWAKLVTLEAIGGTQGDGQGLVFAWRRVGEAPASCENVSVYRDGLAFASTCQVDPPTALGQTHLTGNQMNTLYGWMESLASFDYQSSDLASAGSPAIALIFNGSGVEQAGTFEYDTLNALALEILTQVQTTPNEQDLATAQVALVAYLSALASGNYVEAAALYGGSLEQLQVFNPTIAADDQVSLFRAACTQNGFFCNLGVRNFVHQVQLAPDRFRFTLEFSYPDGSLFALGPCCGADPELEPPWTQFDFEVLKLENGLFLVQNLPPWAP